MGIPEPFFLDVDLDWTIFCALLWRSMLKSPASLFLHVIGVERYETLREEAL